MSISRVLIGVRIFVCDLRIAHIAVMASIRSQPLRWGWIERVPETRARRSLVADVAATALRLDPRQFALLKLARTVDRPAIEAASGLSVPD
jgi:hypothetical protein